MATKTKSNKITARNGTIKKYPMGINYEIKINLNWNEHKKTTWKSVNIRTTLSLLGQMHVSSNW